MKNIDKAPTVFISYSWDSEEHKVWVKNLSEKLSLHGIKTILDQNDLEFGDQMTKFMEQSIKESDFVLIICTSNYKKKADQRIGGVGYEETIITADVCRNRNDRKYITVLAPNNRDLSVPIWAESKYSVDLSTKTKFEENFDALVKTILGRESVSQEKETTNKTSSYDHLFGYFKEAPESLQVILLENICNTCSQVDILDSYRVLEDLCLFLDKIENTMTLKENVKTIHAKAKKVAERLLIEDMRDLWNGR